MDKTIGRELNLEEKLINLISEKLEVEKEKLSLESDFYTDLNVSKLEVADLIASAQLKLKIKLEADDFNEVETIGDLVKLFEESSDEI